VSSRKQDLCDAVAAEVEAATGRRALGLACHVGDWDANRMGSVAGARQRAFPGPVPQRDGRRRRTLCPRLQGQDRRRDAHASRRGPDEIVGPVLYLASNASSYVTGDDISGSGGMQK
jgi:hypothetical protein